MKRWVIFGALAASIPAGAVSLWHGGGEDAFPLYRYTGLVGTFIPVGSFDNPQPNIPAQCYIETSGGTQNACLFCHTDGLADRALGNNNPQSELQLAYSFAPGMNVNHWENTLFPAKLREAVAAVGDDPGTWDMEAYVRQDNWGEAFAKRGGDVRVWNSAEGAYRLMPGLDPADLPADGDGFVRSENPAHGFFFDGKGWNTGWRAVNFMPYGIFTPMTGSVSGIYLRLPQRFMKDASGAFDLEIYKRNLDLLVRAIQDRLEASDPSRYWGGAGDVPVEAGLYPVGTEFAHPLHYVDVEADGSDPQVNPFPGTRSRRVKEVRWMYKWRPFDPAAIPAGEEEEEGDLGNVLANPEEGWIDNGAGWILSAFIEDAGGRLRPQTPEELMQCRGCHGGIGAGGDFKTGTGNTVDSTWSLVRKLAGDIGWREMDYLGYRHLASEPRATPGIATLGDPINRGKRKGEFRYFLEKVVGASLYGDMPDPIEAFLAQTITRERGYSADWPALDTSDPQSLLDIQRLRQALMGELTARGEYLDDNGVIRGALLYPPKEVALEAARRYRQVVVTQRYTLGKDVFPETPFTFRYYRPGAFSYTHANGRPYAQGEVITDRPVDVLTLIGILDEDTFDADYTPFPAYPPAFEGDTMVP